VSESFIGIILTLTFAKISC